MAIVRPIIRPIVRAITQSITGAPSAIQRYFWDFTAAASQYGDFSSDIVLSGDFEIEWTDALDDDASTYTVYGESAGGQSVQHRFGGLIRLRLPVNTVTFPGYAAVKDGKLHVRSVRRVGNDFIYREDGVDRQTINNPTAAAETLTLNTLAQNNSANYLDSAASDLFIWKDGDRTTGTLIADFPLDTDLSNPVIANRAAGAPGAPATLTMQNMTTADAEPLRRLDTSFSPNRWVNVNDPNDFIEVAGT